MICHLDGALDGAVPAQPRRGEEGGEREGRTEDDKHGIGSMHVKTYMEEFQFIFLHI